MLKKNMGKKLVSIVAAATMMVQCFFSPVAVQTVQASGNASSALVTEYKPTITQKTSETSGLVHPGVGLTKELLDNVQTQVRAAADPWTTYFNEMLVSSAASKTPSIKLSDPANTKYNSQGTNSMFIADALTAYTQAILYYVTGDNVYRKNAIDIFRIWAQMNPENYAYFTDACIHTGIPMNRMCMAAEIIRYSSYETTAGYSDTDLNWTDAEITAFINNLVKPSVDTFMSSPDEFMNQHMYTTLGAMSAYLFMDDAEGYAKTVEWFMVNEEGANPGFNGSIKRLFREIKTLDVVGGVEGTGTPLETPVIQHVEMGRDQAHGCGDVTNATIMARLMRGQNTKVDPEAGTVSEAGDAVDAYEFLDNRILTAADFFFKYTLGYADNDEWVPVAFSIRDGKIVDLYTAFSPEYRGRYKTINFWDLYTYYTYINPVDLEENYPYFYEGFMKKFASNYYWNGGSVINWDNVDFGGDFWLWIPAEAANDSNYIAEAQVDYQLEVEDRGSMVENETAMSIGKDGDVEYVRFAKSDAESKLAMSSSGVLDQQTIAFRIRTDGMAKLSLSNGVSGSIYLPDTDGEWQYVTFTRAASESFGDFYYVIVSEIEGSYVDIDVIDIKPSIRNDSRTIDIVSFTGGNEELGLVTYVGAPLNIDFRATDSVTGQTVSYAGINLPEGAGVNATTGAFTWTPDSAGSYSFYVSAKANATEILKKVEVIVEADRDAAIEKAIADVIDEEYYTSTTYAEYEVVLDATRAMVTDGSTDAAFATQLNKLCEAVAGLGLLSPKLENDPYTDGTSLDYTDIVYSSTMGDQIYRMADGIDTYCVYSKAVNKAHIMDFGPDFKVSVTKFGYKARLGFSDRVAGVQVFGSNDNKNWTQLTVSEAQYIQQYHEVDVKEEECDNKYRYLKIVKTTEYPEALRGDAGNLLEFGELRIYGTRYETGNMIASVSMSSEDAEGGIIESGGTVTLTIGAKAAISEVKVTIQGTEVNATSEDGVTWIANAVMTEENPIGKIEIAIDYKKADGTAGDTFYETTDGSSLLLIDSSKKIDVLNVAKAFDCVSNRRANVTPEQNTKNLFDGNFSTFGEVLNDGTGYYTVDFGVGVRVNLEAVLFMPRNDQEGYLSGRTNGMIVSGSNDGKNWTKITTPVADATYTKWSMKSGDDLINKDSYRYFKIGGAQFGNAEEVEFYGTLVEKNDVESISIASEDGDGGRVKAGNTVTLQIVGKAALENVTATFYGQQVTATSADNGITWTAEAEVTEAWTPGSVTFDVTYEGGDTYTETTDGSYLFLMDTTKYIDTANVAKDITSVSNRRNEYTAETNAACLFDGNLSTYGEVLNDGTGYYTVDFGAGARVSLESVMLMPRTESTANAGRMAGMIVSGSINGQDWIQITEAVSEPVQGMWTLIEKDAFLNKDAYRYFKISGGEFGNVAEVELYGTMENGFTIDSISLSSDSELLQNKVSMGNTVQLTIVASKELQSVVTKIQGQDVTATTTDNYTWTASVEVTDSFDWGYVDFTVDYVDASGEPGETCTETTDGTYLFIIDAEKYINTAELASLTCVGNKRVNEYTAEENTALLFDGNLGENGKNFGELLNDSNSYYLIDFGAGNGIRLETVMLMPRADQIGRMKGVIVSGSNDGVNWTPLTNGVSDVAAERWTVMNQILDDGLYQYLKISGGQYGNITEVEFYGVIEQLNDTQILENAKATVTSNLANYTLEQENAATAEDAKAAIEAYVATLGLEGIIVAVTTAENGFIAAETGTNGSYSFTVTLSAEGLEPVVTDELIVEIEAPPAHPEINYLDESYKLSRFSRLTGGYTENREEITTSYKDNNPISNLTDNNATTYVEYRHDQNVSPAYIQVDFTEGKAVKLAHFTIQARQDQVNRAKLVTLDASNDGESWVTVAASTPQGITDLQTILIKEEYADQAFRYIRLYDPEYEEGNGNGDSFLSIAEFHIFGEVVTVEVIPDQHQHTFSAEWTSDDTYHWHAATCEHTEETLDKAEHTSSDWIVDAAASTTAPGSRHKECTVCEKVLVTEEIPQLPGDVTGGITGTVKSFRSDSTVDNTTTIQLMDVSGNVIAQTTVTANSDSYTLTDVSAGDYTVQVSKEDHVTREYNVTVGTEMVTLNVEVWLLGDVNGDGDVTVKDKKVIFNHMEGTSALTDYAFAVGDVDGNGDIVAKDKKMIYNHIEGNSLLWN